MGSSWRLIHAYCGCGLVGHMSGDGRTALVWPPKPPWLATHRLVHPEVNSNSNSTSRRYCGSGPTRSCWRMIRAYCGYGIVVHMSGDGRTALGWPPKPPWLATHRLVHPEVNSISNSTSRRYCGSGPTRSCWRMIHAYCGYGIAEHMPGDGRTALGWPPKPP